jgi:putative membrane-bound dehydrogenase-like protein
MSVKQIAAKQLGVGQICHRFSRRVLAALMLSWVSVTAIAEDPRNELPRKQHRDSEAPFLSPSEAVAKMAIPAGFSVQVFASEPDIAEPIAFCFDDRGRIWVLENFNYQTRRQNSDDPVSRIQILEDTNGDGVMDKKKTFTDKLTFSSGIACGFGGVFVGSPPNLTFIADADGDDKPDGPPKVLLDGWGMRDRHETLNSFNWGPDGWLYGCHGVFTHSNVGRPGDDESQRQFIDAGIWRYHPVRKSFEIFARGLSNSWGFDFDDHGQGFATCCVIPHLFHVVQGGVYHKQSQPHVNPYVYDDIKTIRDHKHLSAHGGARFYLADAFPPKYRNRLFMCNIHEHAVLTDVMVPKGSSFIGKHGDDFMPTNDLAWVGFSVETGPEGGVYILDWHDQDICGNAVKFPNSGRIYRIMPKDAQAVTTRDLAALSDDQLVDLQTDSNDWYVRRARILLQQRASEGKLDAESVHEKLNAIFASSDHSPQLLRALWALHVTGGLQESRLIECLNHPDPHVRAWSIQLLCDRSGVNAFQPDRPQDQHLSPAVHDRLVELARTDASPVVRLYLASAVQRIPYEKRWPILTGLLSRAEDAQDHNLPRMYWFALEPMVPLHPQRSLDLVIAGKLPSLQESVARRLATSDTPSEAVVNLRNVGRFDKLIQTVAKGFRVRDVGEGGVVAHQVFRNATAVQTHPKSREKPCVLHTGQYLVPANQTTKLRLRVSHHPHGDWQLRVVVNRELQRQMIVGPQTVGDDEWLDLIIDLTKYAGQRIDVALENRANDWHNEWAYWNRVEIVSE